MPAENFLIPTIAQNCDSGQVLMLAYSNRLSLRKSLETGDAHYWSRSRNGNWIVKRNTMSARLTRSVQAIDQWCRANRHERLGDQHAVLCQKTRGHDAYYGITGNGESLQHFRYLVHRAWRRWLRRRHRKRKLDWPKFNRLLARFPLPPLRVVHSIFGREAKV